MFNPDVSLRPSGTRPPRTVELDLPGFVEIAPNTYARRLDPRLPPVVIHRTGDPQSVIAALKKNGWDLVFSKQEGTFNTGPAHFHTVFEASIVRQGIVRGRIGGDRGPVVTLRKGDVMMKPPGTHHQGVDSTDDAVYALAYQTGVSPTRFSRFDWHIDRTLDRLMPKLLERTARMAPDPVTGGPLPT